MKGLATLVAVLAVTPAALGQSTISYSPYHFGGEWDRQTLDVNQDGTVDFTFESRWWITMDVPTSGMGYSFGVRPGPGNYVLGLGADAAVLSQGETISPTPIGPASWQYPKYGPVNVCHWNADLIRGTWSGWFGPMAGLDETYLGLRFAAADGEHYGWTRVRLRARGAEPVDHAYDVRPDAQILAGAVPEPSSAVLLAVGAATVCLFARRRRMPDSTIAAETGGRARTRSRAAFVVVSARPPVAAL